MGAPDMFNPMTMRAMYSNPSLYQGQRAVQESRYVGAEAGRGSQQELGMLEGMGKAKGPVIKRQSAQTVLPRK